LEEEEIKKKEEKREKRKEKKHLTLTGLLMEELAIVDEARDSLHNNSV
jgi:hypothetical protein